MLGMTVPGRHGLLGPFYGKGNTEFQKGDLVCSRSVDEGLAEASAGHRALFAIWPIKCRKEEKRKSCLTFRRTESLDNYDTWSLLCGTREHELKPQTPILLAG